MSNKKLVEFLFELKGLRQVSRSGWRKLGVDYENVTEHSFRVALLSFVLARMEKVEDPYRVAFIALLHDVHEVRVGDTDRVHKRYNSTNDEHAAREQFVGVEHVGDEFFDIWNEYNEGQTQAAQIVKDADLLEMALSARELQTSGHDDAKYFIQSASEGIATNSARQLLSEIREGDPSAWWKRIG